MSKCGLVKDECKIFGKPDNLSKKVLPTYSDIVKCYFVFSKFKNPCTVLGNLIINIWKKLQIPTIHKITVIQLIKKYIQKYKSVIKSYNSTHRSKEFEEKIENFRKSGENLFDLTACKCSDITMCKCSKENRVPDDVIEFLIDQRGPRILKIPRDKMFIEDQEKSIKRSNKNIKSNFENDDSDCESLCNSDPEFILPTKKLRLSTSPKPNTDQNTKQNRIDIGPIVEQCDRYGVSRRAAAAISTATLLSVGLIDNSNNKLAIDKNKIQRQSISKRESLRHFELKNIK